MSHWYHNPFSFFLEELQALTNEGKIEWIASEPTSSSGFGYFNRYETLLKASNCLITISIDRQYLYLHSGGGPQKTGDCKTLALQSEVDVGKSGFYELVKTIVASVILKQAPFAKEALEEVKEMWDDFRKESFPRNET
jgi:hypothetical protein